MPVVDLRVMKFLDDCCVEYSGKREQSFRVPHDGRSFSFREIRDFIHEGRREAEPLYGILECLYYTTVLARAIV